MRFMLRGCYPAYGRVVFSDALEDGARSEYLAETLEEAVEWAQRLLQELEPSIWEGVFGVQLDVTTLCTDLPPGTAVYGIAAREPRLTFLSHEPTLLERLSGADPTLFEHVYEARVDCATLQRLFPDVQVWRPLLHDSNLLPGEVRRQTSFFVRRE